MAMSEKSREELLADISALQKERASTAFDSKTW
jgi:hypothetical protein